MTTVAIEFSDAGLVAAREDRALLESPGFALLTRSDIVFGEDAARQAHLLPNQINNRFWRELSLRPLARRHQLAHTLADLAHGHLQTVWEWVRDDCDSVILVVPGSYQTDQLELLLGIADELSLPVRGVVDSAVAACRAVKGCHRLLHIDMGLHDTLLSRLTQEERVSLAGVSQCEDAGLVRLREAWVKYIAALFVRTTRFDPLHSAQTEQQIHDRLPDILRKLQDGSDYVLELEDDKHSHGVSLGPRDLIAAGESLYRRIGELVAGELNPEEPVALQLSHRLSGLPGLGAALSGLSGAPLIELPAGAGALGALRQWRTIHQSPDALQLRTELPTRNKAVAKVRCSESAGTATRRFTATGPTHLLYRGIAYPVGVQALVVGLNVAGDSSLRLRPGGDGLSDRHFTVTLLDGQMLLEDFSSAGTFVNGRKIQGRQVLRIGDRIRAGTPGEEFEAIALAIL